jgi:hypothetical protein
MHKLYATALSLGMALAFCLRVVSPASPQALAPTNPQTESVQGTVVNSVTHEAIGRALVFSPDNRYATMTDGEGHFELTFPPASGSEDNTGSNRPESSRPDLLMARKPGFLSNHYTRISNLSRDKELTISLTPEALITGRVTLPSSDESDRIRVELYHQQVRGGRAYWVSGGMAMTRSNGEFRFADLSSGTYKIVTRELLDRDPLTFDPHGQLYGYPPVYFPNAQDFASAQAIQLSAGQTFQGDISLVRQAYYPVKVAVANVPAGVGVSLNVYAAGRGPGYELGYNGREHAIEGMLPNGNYTLEASTYGTNAATGLLNITVKGAPVEGSQLVVVPNGSVTVVVNEEFTSSSNGSSESPLGGRASKLEGPDSYLRVNLEPADDFGPEQHAFLGRLTQSEDKSFVLDNVRPGRYWMRIHSHRGFPAVVTCGGVDLKQQPLMLAGGSNTQVEVTMRDDGAEVEGTVEGVARTPGDDDGSAAHIYLVPLPDGGGDFREAWVSPEGRFNLEQVPPGLYQALAFDQPQPELEYHNAEAMREYESRGQVVRLSAGQKEQLRVQVISPSE